MFDIGFTELLLVGIIGLLILGPRRLPIAVRTLGKWVGKAKNIIGGVQQQIEEELRAEDLEKKAKAHLGLDNTDDKTVAASSNLAHNQAQLDFLNAEIKAMEATDNSQPPAANS